MPLELHSPEVMHGRRGRLGELTSRTRARMIDLVSRMTLHKAGLALVYHRIGDPPGDPRYELVPQLGLDEFTRQVHALARRYRVVFASELPRAVASRRRGGRFPVALTFDDSLVSHVRIAAPVLGEAGLPATFFLNGDGSRREPFWWEDLQRAVDRQALDPDSLPGLDTAEIAAVCERRPGAIRRLAAAFERVDPSRRRALEARLRERAGTQLERSLTATEIGALAAQGFEIGFHTLDHEALPALDDASLRRALDDGRSALAAAAGRPIRLLAYPHGKADERVAEAARSAGYELAYAGSARSVQAGAPALLLPRWEPPFDGGSAFELAVARSLRR